MALARFEQGLVDFVRGATARILLIFVLFFAVLTGWILHSRPPEMIRMATGPEGLGYHRIAPLYKAELDDEAEPGNRIAVKLLTPTKGSRENVDMLLAGSACQVATASGASEHADVALVAGGIIVTEITQQGREAGMISAKDVPCLESLGTVLGDPLWLFLKPGIKGEGINSLRGKTIAIGTKGSGTRVLAKTLLADHEFSDKDFTEAVRQQDHEALTPKEAKDALVSGKIDAAFFVGAWRAEIVQDLLRDEHVELSGYPQAKTYADRHPYLRVVVLPQGAASLAKDRPGTDVTLIATKASLVVRRDLHPAIKSLLLKAARKIHSGQSVFQHTDEFPSAEAVGLQLSPTAQQFYEPDLPFVVKELLNNYRPQWVPYWAGEKINQLLLFALVVVGALSTFWATTQSLVYIWDLWVRYRIHRLHGALVALEKEFEAPGNKKDPFATTERLDVIERQAKRIKVIIAYAPMLFRLWRDIDLARKRYADRAAERAADNKKGP
jgi:TRAP-type uncharacterized transport system substrate-binding protein